MSDTEHRCAAAEACRGFNPVTKVATQTDGEALCEECLSDGTRAVGVLPHDYRDLEQMLPKSLGEWSDGQPVPPGRTSAPPAPMRLEVEALQRDIWWLTTAWAEVLEERDRLAPPPHRRPSPLRLMFAASYAGVVSAIGTPSRVEHPTAVAQPMRPGPTDVVRATTILQPRVRLLASLAEVEMWTYPTASGDPLTLVTGAQGVLDLAWVHRRARSMLGLTEPVYELPGRCQDKACGRAELRVRDGSDTVWCDRCGAMMTRDDYDRYGNLFLRPSEVA